MDVTFTKKSGESQTSFCILLASNYFPDLFGKSPILNIATVGSRLSSWLKPIFISLTNREVHFCAFDKKNWLALISSNSMIFGEGVPYFVLHGNLYEIANFENKCESWFQVFLVITASLRQGLFLCIWNGYIFKKMEKKCTCKKAFSFEGAQKFAFFLPPNPMTKKWVEVAA